MPQILLKTYDNNTLNIDFQKQSLNELYDCISLLTNIPCKSFYLEGCGNTQSFSNYCYCNTYHNDNNNNNSTTSLDNIFLNNNNDDDGDFYFFEMKMKINGGIDFQHREGSKIGSGIYMIYN